MNKMIKQYRNHRDGAKVRGIPFNLSFEQWISIWTASGKYNQRGRKKGQYVMCRKNDIGPYEIGNVFIATNRENIQQAWLGKKRGPQSEEHKQKVNQYKIGKKQSLLTIKKRVIGTRKTKSIVTL